MMMVTTHNLKVQDMIKIVTPIQNEDIYTVTKQEEWKDFAFLAPLTSGNRIIFKTNGHTYISAPERKRIPSTKVHQLNNSILEVISGRVYFIIDSKLQETQ